MPIIYPKIDVDICLKSDHIAAILQRLVTLRQQPTRWLLASAKSRLGAKKSSLGAVGTAPDSKRKSPKSQIFENFVPPIP